MRRGAVTGRAEIQLAWFGLGQGNQVRDRPDPELRADYEDVGLTADQRDRVEIRQRIEGEVLIQEGVGRQNAVVRHQQRVAVRGLLCGDLGRDVAPGAGAVIDHHGLFQFLVQLLPDDPGQHVAGSTGRECNEQPQGLGRISGRPRRQAGGGRNTQTNKTATHEHTQCFLQWNGPDNSTPPCWGQGAPATIAGCPIFAR